MIIRKNPNIRFKNPGPSRVPPGQFVTQQWPVLHFGTVPKVDLSTWTFSIGGEVENPVSWTWEEFQRLPRVSRKYASTVSRTGRASTTSGRACRSATCCARASDASSPLRHRDRAGFWEENGYHMRGDPWREERFREQSGPMAMPPLMS